MNYASSLAGTRQRPTIEEHAKSRFVFLENRKPNLYSLFVLRSSTGNSFSFDDPTHHNDQLEEVIKTLMTVPGPVPEEVFPEVQSLIETLILCSSQYPRYVSEISDNGEEVYHRRNEPLELPQYNLAIVETDMHGSLGMHLIEQPNCEGLVAIEKRIFAQDRTLFNAVYSPL